MFEQFIKRENDIFNILQIFLDDDLDFIVVGGYAVSAFKHRFSVDVDIVIRSDDLKKFEDLLKHYNYKKTIAKELKDTYASQFIRYQKKEALTVSIDLLVGGLKIRQTGYSLEFNALYNNSMKINIKGREKEVLVKIPVKELLIAIKLHSGRLTDLRDIVAISKDIDINKIKKFLGNKDNKTLKRNIKQLLSLLDKKDFIDSFRGVFMEKKFDINVEEIRKLKTL